MLPPSEGKAAPERGRRFDPGALSHPELAGPREQVLQALIRASAGADATTRLRFGASLAEQVEANTRLRDARAAPAAQVYSGVLYDAAGLVNLSGTARRRSNSSVRIVSALWGVLRPDDAIPAYRLSMSTPLQPLAPLGTFWSRHLGGALDPGGSDVVLDCRSQDYARAWSPAPDREWLAVRVVAIRSGRPVVVSHHAKHTRGVLTGHLFRRPEPLPRTAAGVAAAAAELIGPVLADVGLHPPVRSGPATLELVLSD
ncbi:YaaA family protein [Pseudactinotalea sp. Z1732]|uniref:YaaA family protein n=1 Tax=Micrococcales TaxID=85006 RepID=UPI003C798982